MTYVQESKTNRLSLSLRDLGIDENTSYGLNSNRYDLDLLMFLVMFTPTNQSHLGKKFASYSKLNKSTLDRFLTTVFSGLGVKSVYLFNSFTEKGNKKNDLRNHVLNDKDTMICLRCENGARDSLFMSIRNSIAHGNIIEKDGFLVFYSISDDKNEYDSAVTFFLKIRKTTKLQALKKALEAYE